MLCSNDGTLGPASNCRPFDFTLQFEELILTVLPNALLLAAALPRMARILHAHRHSLLRLSQPEASLTPASRLGNSAYFVAAGAAAALTAAALSMGRSGASPAAAGATSLAAMLALLPLHFLELAHDWHVSSRQIGDVALPYLLVTVLCDAARVRTLYMIPSATDARLAALLIAVLCLKAGMACVLNSSALPPRERQHDGRTAEERASLLSRLFFGWLFALIWRGFRRPLTLDTIDALGHEFQGTVLRGQMRRFWGKPLALHTSARSAAAYPQKGSALDSKSALATEDDSISLAQLPSVRDEPSPASSPAKGSSSLSNALLKAFGWDLLLPAVPQAAYLAAQLANPFLVSATIKFAQSYSAPAGGRANPEPVANGGGLVGAWALVYLVIAVSAGQLSWTIGRASVKLRGALIEIVYEDSLRLHLRSAHSFGGGAASNLLSVDTERIIACIRPLHTLWSGIVQLIVATYLLYNQVGIAFLSALVVIVMCTFLVPLLSWGMDTRQDRWSSATDQRTNLAASVFKNIKNIKLAAYEDVIFEKLQQARKRELHFLKRFMWQDIIVSCWSNSASRFIALTLFISMSLINERELLTTDKVFTTITIIGLINQPFMQIGQDYAQLVTAVASLRRIQDFCTRETVPELDSERAAGDGTAAVLEGATISWSPDEEKAVLRNVSLCIPAGKLTMICGRSATGKSTLLQTFLGETDVLAGSYTGSIARGRVAYVPQDAWLQESLTVRANILFASPYDPERFRRVIQATALDVDLAQLAKGDQSTAKTLSGGQRQRLSLARALYYDDADFFIADDFLSALDAETAARVWTALMGPNGMLKGKTVIMATNAMHLLTHADHVIRLGDGTVQEQGAYASLSMKGKGIVERASLEERRSLELEERKPAEEPMDDDDDDEEIEETQQSAVSLGAYSLYVRCCGTLRFLFDNTIMLCQSAASLGSTYALSYWVDSVQQGQTKEGPMALYIVTVVVGTVILFGVDLRTAGHDYVVASFHVHSKMIRGALAASFEQLPPGAHILSRCSQDLYFVDAVLVMWWTNFFYNGFGAIGTIVSMAIPAPYMLAVAAGMLGFYFLLQRLYIGASRQLRRIELATKGPIYSLIGETCSPSGLATIRAFGRDGQFMHLNTARVNTSQRPFLLLFGVRAWLQLAVNVLALVMNASLIGILVALRYSSGIGLLAVALTRASSLSSNLNWTLIPFTELEMSAVALERIKQLVDLPSEGGVMQTAKQTAQTELEDGSIELDIKTAAYHSAPEHPILRNLSLQIRSGERIGVCGRSGAGKSSLLLALFGTLQLDEASDITIGGRSLKKWDVRALRAQMSLIPQHALILAATVRENIDVEGVHDDAQIWDVLRKCKLEDMVNALPDKLETVLGGENVVLSPGQQQLFTFARALLRKRKILCMDESTSSLDEQSDREIQEVLKSPETFAECTVITIAHRIATIIDNSDRILVLGGGRILEFDTPANLLAKPDSAFRALAVEQRCV